MRVCAYAPTNTYIGQFDIDRPDAIAAGVEQFARVHQLGSYSYFECDERTWTLVPGSSGLELQEGRVQDPTPTPVAAIPTEPIDIERRSGWSEFLRVMGVLCILVGLLGLIALVDSRDRQSEQNAFICLVGGLVGAIQSFFFAFLVDVFTDTRWFIKKIADERSRGA